MFGHFKKLILEEYSRNAKRMLLLTEPSAEPTSKSPNFEMIVEIIDAPSDRLLIGIPKEGKVHSGMLRSMKNYKKSCDYLLLIQNRDSIDAYFIELKTNLSLNAAGVPVEPCNQILCTTPFLDYMISMVEVHFDQKNNVNRHFVVIADSAYDRIRKQSVKSIRPVVCEYKKKKFRVIHSVQTIPFTTLQCPTP